jgi:GNAT superfamily N-acetyltransferase
VIVLGSSMSSGDRQGGPIRQFSGMAIRPADQQDFAQWLPLWQGYCGFYGRPHDPVLPPDAVTTTTWLRFFDPAEPVHALVAAVDGQLIGLAHYIFHRNTGTIGPVCYLQDLFTTETVRGHGVGRGLIEGVYAAATAAGAERVYWQTQHSDTSAIALYDKVATQLAVHVYRRELRE